MSAQTVLVTGGTGYLGSHIISRLLAGGFKVRASEKKLRTIFPNASAEQLEAFEVPSVEADHAKAFKGVGTLMHIASPSTFDGSSNEDILKGAYTGSVSIIEAAIKAGIKKIIATSSIAALIETDFSNGFGSKVIGPDTWGSIKTYNEIDTSPTCPGPLYIYQTAKTAAEHRIWQLADEHPDVDITTLLPSMMIGPFVPNFLNVTSASPGSLATNSFVQALLDTPDHQYPPNPMGLVVDVRDVAEMHILAISAPPLPNKERKRLITSNKNFTWDEIVKVLRANFPEAVGKRLPAEGAPVIAQLSASLDTSLGSRALGFNKYRQVEQTYVASLQAVLDWEAQLKA